MTSILETVKKLLGLTKADDSFDTDIIVHINSVFAILTQMGVGPVDGFSITGYDELWDSFTTSNAAKTKQIKSYIYLKVRSIFDPSANANINNAFTRAIEELEYRLFIEEDGAKYIADLALLELEEEEVVDE